MKETAERDWDEGDWDEGDWDEGDSCRRLG